MKAWDQKNKFLEDTNYKFTFKKVINYESLIGTESRYTGHYVKKKSNQAI